VLKHQTLPGMSDHEMEEKGGKGGNKEDSDSKHELSFAYALGKFKSAALSSLTNRYMLANIVYLGYTIGILIIGTAPHCTLSVVVNSLLPPDFGTEDYETKEINRLFQGTLPRVHEVRLVATNAVSPLSGRLQLCALGVCIPVLVGVARNPLAAHHYDT
jgi:hypothetical protein